jgi:hypothetical protein
MSTESHKEVQSSAGLSLKQKNAIDLLVTGLYDREVAEKVSVQRETVTRWRLYDSDFRIELDRARYALWSKYADKMRSLLPKALRVVDEGLEHEGFLGDRLKLALSILKIAKLDFNSGPERDEASGTRELMENQPRKVDRDATNTTSTASGVGNACDTGDRELPGDEPPGETSAGDNIGLTTHEEEHKSPEELGVTKL